MKEYMYKLKEGSCLKKKFSITLNYSYSKGVRADLGAACVNCLGLRKELVSALQRHFVYVYREVFAVEHMIR